MKTSSADSTLQSKNLTRTVLVVALLLLVPLVAMLFTDEVAWTLSDFVVAGVLLLGAGFSYELLASRAHTTTKRAIIGGVVLVALAVVWIQLAVGIFD